MNNPNDLNLWPFKLETAHDITPLHLMVCIWAKYEVNLSNTHKVTKQFFQFLLKFIEICFWGCISWCIHKANRHCLKKLNSRQNIVPGPWKVFECYNMVQNITIDQNKKYYNIPVPYPTMHPSGQKCAHFCSEGRIVGYGTGALWNLLEWSVMHTAQQKQI